MTVMSSTRQRIKELYDKMTRGGITRDERVELTALEARVEVADLQKIETNKAKAEIAAEIAQINAETAEILAQAQQEQGLLEIFRTDFNGRRLINNEAVRQMIIDLSLGEEDRLGARWFASALKHPKVAIRFKDSWTTSRPDPNARKLQEETDRATFSKVCRSYDVSEIEANFKLLVDVLGAGFSEYEAAQSIKSNALQLSPATPQELTEWEQENVRAHNEWLLTSDVRTLKKIVANETQANRQAHLQAQADYDLEQRTRIQEQQGFEPLPIEHKGQPVNKAFFLKCSRETMQYFLKRYGSAQVDQRIRSAA